VTENSNRVGQAIAAALDRAEELRSLSDRPARVRIMTSFGDDRSGLTIHASIAARTPAELHAQHGVGKRTIPWNELDARADEIPGLVDAVVGEVTLAVQSAPQVPRPSRSASTLEIDAFEGLVDELGGTLTRSAMAVLEARHKVEKLSRGVGSEATMLAALKLAALSAYTAHVGLSDIQDELRRTVDDVMSKMAGSLENLPRPALNS
jgi:hypothetical protein